MALPKMNKQWMWIAIIVVVALGGYVLAFFQFKNNVSLEQKLLNDDLGKIGVIDDELAAIRKDKAITLEELKESQDKINRLIEEAEKRDTSTLNLEEALKIINELQ